MSRTRISLEARGVFSFVWRVVDTETHQTLARGGPTPGRSRAMSQARSAQGHHEWKLRNQEDTNA